MIRVDVSSSLTGRPNNCRLAQWRERLSYKQGVDRSNRSATTNFNSVIKARWCNWQTRSAQTRDVVSSNLTRATNLDKGVRYEADTSPDH